MARIEDFENHVWRDVVDADTLAIYAAYARETFVGPNPAVIAIDLYNSAYRGGPRPPVDLQAEFPSSCGVNAWNALAPTKKLFAAARAAGVPIFYCTSDTRPHAKPRTKPSATRRQRHAAIRTTISSMPNWRPSPRMSSSRSSAPRSSPAHR